MGRLDTELAARALARSRSHAQTLIASGAVTVNGTLAEKASMVVGDTDGLVVAGGDQYVSRAAGKLVAALDVFGVDPAGVIALDVGASTGGFTQVLLERGAAIVVAVDVGHGQMAPSIAADSRVRVVEGLNAKEMTAASWPGTSGGASAPALIVGDVSFISLTHILPALDRVADPGADMLLLVKPQFEVGRSGVQGGIVRSSALKAEAIRSVGAAAVALGWGVAGLAPSPVTGTHGNSEYLIHLSRTAGVDQTEWEKRVIEMIGA